MTPTVLIFLKAPVAGAVKTRLAVDVGEAEALRIYRWLAERQLAAIPSTWPVEVHFSPAPAAAEMKAWLGEAKGRTFWPQVEAGLGERLRHAMAGAFARSAEAVFLIGGDCPGLNAKVLNRARDALREHDVVMGPACDGGYYLLGMTTARPELLHDIAWSSDRVASQTRQRVEAAGLALAELNPLRDVDRLADWRAVERRD
ncbi:TIGR04282 family arsenosugar biosynthesis glycosyltransferase [Synoicihabitans lomoniglobus]|uniref:TIGR04282 family arsenosugar biosynthesis glycosyltransferase n=1 Tax=Synoicihabitans lomoniglobus TaxID=2909285 RepID=A0AAE9ZZA3_9BACT|nr:TIGR04282 family arsenosugar biosynthesis glycosyltransferase [Opitutaceae bacterium LMO-M01]WED65528.1 TIGR04282 family arsenosugar biosynthesis glycosyltransferase [Opitutaceae bacterium LMO-M01]